MSVTFSIEGHYDVDEPSTYLNLNQRNGRDLLWWLDLAADDPQPYGTISGRELAARCRRRLWDVARNHGAELPGGTSPDGRVIEGGRDAGYLRRRTAELLALAERAGDACVSWD